MAEHTRRILERRLVKDLPDRYANEMHERASKAVMPDELAAQVATLIEQTLEMPLDETVSRYRQAESGTVRFAKPGGLGRGI